MPTSHWQKLSSQLTISAVGAALIDEHNQKWPGERAARAGYSFFDMPSNEAQ
jgi:hypothetical protein